MKSWKEVTREVMMILLGIVVVVGFFLLLNNLITNEVPEGNRDLLNIIIGALVGSFITIIAYYFGSSKGSADKTGLLEKEKKE